MPSIRSRFLPLAVFMLLPLAVACEREPETEPMPADTQPATVEAVAPPAELMTAIDQYTAAWNGDDPARVAALHTEDATVIVDDETYQGRDAILSEWAEPGVSVVRDLQVTEQINERIGDDYRSAGTYTHFVDSPDAEAVEVSGRYTFTWTRDADGEWKVRSAEIHQDVPDEG